MFPREPIAAVSNSTDGYRTFLITKNGKVYSSGYAYQSRHGYPGIIAMQKPMLVLGFPEDVQISQVSAGICHTLYLTTEGDVYVSGENADGQLGCGKLSDVLSQPTRLNTFPAGTKFSQVAAGRNHSLFLTRDHQVYVCGSDELGQLGLNIRIKSLTPTLLRIDPDAHSHYWSQREQAPAEKICQVFARDSLSYFINDKGTLYGCGANRSHYIHPHSTTPWIRVPSSMTGFPQGTEITQIAIGCDPYVLTKTGKVYYPAYGKGNKDWEQILFPDGVEICKVAATREQVLFLSRHGQVYIWRDPSFSDYRCDAGIPAPELLQGVPDGTLICDLAGFIQSMLLVSQRGEVFGKGSNLHVMLGVGSVIELDDMPLHPESANAVQYRQALEELRLIVQQTVLISPKNKHAMFKGQAAEPLREITSFVNALFEKTYDVVKALQTIVALAEKVGGKQHPILLAAKTCLKYSSGGYRRQNFGMNCRE